MMLIKIDDLNDVLAREEYADLKVLPFDKKTVELVFSEETDTVDEVALAMVASQAKRPKKRTWTWTVTNYDTVQTTIKYQGAEAAAKQHAGWTLNIEEFMKRLDIPSMEIHHWSNTHETYREHGLSFKTIDEAEEVISKKGSAAFRKNFSAAQEMAKRHDLELTVDGVDVWFHLTHARYQYSTSLARSYVVYGHDNKGNSWWYLKDTTGYSEAGTSKFAFQKNGHKRVKTSSATQAGIPGQWEIFTK